MYISRTHARTSRATVSFTPHPYHAATAMSANNEPSIKSCLSKDGSEEKAYRVRPRVAGWLAGLFTPVSRCSQNLSPRRNDRGETDMQTHKNAIEQEAERMRALTEEEQKETIDRINREYPANQQALEEPDIDTFGRDSQASPIAGDSQTTYDPDTQDP